MPADAIFSVFVHDEIDSDIPLILRQLVMTGEFVGVARHFRNEVDREGLHLYSVVHVAGVRVSSRREEDVEPGFVEYFAPRVLPVQLASAHRRGERFSFLPRQHSSEEADLSSAVEICDAGCCDGETRKMRGESVKSKGGRRRAAFFSLLPMRTDPSSGPAFETRTSSQAPYASFFPS